MSNSADSAHGFARDQWYAVAWSREIGDRPFARRALGDPVVMFRRPDGRIGALEDRCPHRLAPLSMGECADGGLRCGYHGMVFDETGRCISIPGQEIIPPSARTRAYHAVERYGLVWLWMGERAADLDRLPFIGSYGEPGWAVMDGGYQCHDGNYRIEVENLMDPAHTTFLHKETIGNRAARDVPVEVLQDDRGVTAFRWIENVPPSKLDREAYDFGEARVDRRIVFRFELPSTSLVDIVVIPSGTERTEHNLAHAGTRAYSYKFLTPQTANSTHFFWLHLRNYRQDDTDFEAVLRASLEKTYTEDREMIGAIQQQQAETGVRQRTTIAIDRAPKMALRMIDRMLEAETAVREREPRDRAASNVVKWE